MCNTYLELGRIIRSSNGLFMIVNDFEGCYLLIDLKLKEVLGAAWDINDFRDFIGDVYKQDRIK